MGSVLRSIAGALALAAFAGCAPLVNVGDSILPTQLSLLVELTDGTPLSVVVDLRRNTRHQLDVRVSRGMRFFDGRRLWEIAPARTGDSWKLRLTELLGDTPRDLPLNFPTPPEVLAIDRNDIWVGIGDRVFHCGLARWACAPATDTGRRPMEHVGPKHGFRVAPVGTDLRLTLPMDPTGEGEPILGDVRRIIGLHWVHERFLERNPVLDRLFRGRAALVVRPLPVAPDANLEEWGATEPLVVESAWQIDAGAPNWHGPRDASFSIAAVVNGGEVCFGGRVRDDDSVVGDALTVQAGTVTIEIPLTTSGDSVARDWFGTRFEACRRLPLDGGVPVDFVASLTDVDDEERVTVLASAPLVPGEPPGTLRLP